MNVNHTGDDSPRSVVSYVLRFGAGNVRQKDHEQRYHERHRFCHGTKVKAQAPDAVCSSLKLKLESSGMELWTSR